MSHNTYIAQQWGSHEARQTRVPQNSLEACVTHRTSEASAAKRGLLSGLVKLLAAPAAPSVEACGKSDEVLMTTTSSAGGDLVAFPAAAGGGGGRRRKAASRRLSACCRPSCGLAAQAGEQQRQVGCCTQGVPEAGSTRTEKAKVSPTCKAQSWMTQGSSKASLPYSSRMSGHSSTPSPLGAMNRKTPTWSPNANASSSLGKPTSRHTGARALAPPLGPGSSCRATRSSTASCSGGAAPRSTTTS